jgi:hypothetical protein
MSVKAKFKVDRFESALHQRQIDPSKGWGGDNIEQVEIRTVVLTPVYGNGDPEHENTKFWQASPSGEIKLGTVNPAAWQYFALGDEHYVTFKKAEKAEVAKA